MFVQIQGTPNVNSMKFLVEDEWLDFIWECKTESDALKSPLSESLWGIDGVVYLMFGRKFVSITKTPAASWDELTGVILEVISDYLLENNKIFNGSFQKKDKNLGKNDLEKKIIQLIDEKVQPTIESHGGQIIFVRFDEGTVFLELKGACKGCPSSEITLKHGIQNLLKYYFPEVEKVESL